MQLSAESALAQNSALPFEPIFIRQRTSSARYRRIVISTLGLSSDQLIAGFAPTILIDHGSTLIEAIDQVAKYRTNLQAELDLALEAIQRLLTVGEFLAKTKGA